MLTTQQKEQAIQKYKLHATDTGSADVQVALLSEEISKMLLHLKKNSKDLHSKRGLLRMVAKRRSLLSYLKNEDPKRYASVIKKAGLKK